VLTDSQTKHSPVDGLTVVRCYAPTNEATMEEKEAFYGLLETTAPNKTVGHYIHDGRL
jgi:hypothetical protein